MKEPRVTVFWRNFTIIWTIVFFAAIIYDFMIGNGLDKAELLLPIAVMHDAVLAIYSAEKEFKRWHNEHNGVHPGEVFVILWTLLVFGLIGAALIFHTEYHVPPEVTGSYIVVIGILAITKESKYFYKRIKK